MRRALHCAAALALFAGLAGLAGARVEVPVESSSAFVPRLVIEFGPEARQLPPEQRVATLARDAGVALVWRRTLATGADLVSSTDITSVADAEALAAFVRMKRLCRIQQAIMMWAITSGSIL